MDGASDLRVEGVAYRRADRLPQPADAIAFEFERGPEGWAPQHDVAGLEVREGRLHGTITGSDPYIVRDLMDVRGDDYRALVIRMQATAGVGGQFFWITEEAPTWGEDKHALFQLVADGRYREYRIELGTHRWWAGQTITGIRIDPGGGATAGTFAVDYVRGAG